MAAKADVDMEKLQFLANLVLATTILRRSMSVLTRNVFPHTWISIYAYEGITTEHILNVHKKLLKGMSVPGYYYHQEGPGMFQEES